MSAKMSVLKINGQNAKYIVEDAFESSYELTKIDEKIPAKKVSPEDTQKILAMKPDDITLNFLVNMFADIVDASHGNKSGQHKSKYNTWDTFIVPENYFYPKQPQLTTTIGRFVFNKFVLESSGVIRVSKYIDKTINSGCLGEIDSSVARYLIDEDINKQSFDSYVNHRDTLLYWLIGLLSHTVSLKFSKPLPKVEKMKAELCKKYEKELKSGNIDVMTKITKDLLAVAREELEGDPGMDLYSSGHLNFNNNYRSNSVVKGAVSNQITGEFDFISTSFMNGIAIKDQPAHFNSVIASQYPMSVAMAKTGYMGKKLLALLQMMTTDEPGTDCGTKVTIPLIVNAHNKKDLLYNYIVENGQLKMLTASNIDSYVGKTVQLRSPMTCKNDKICSKCIGDMFYRMDIRNVGLFSTQLSYAALNIGMKLKHDTSITLYTIDPDELITDI